MTELDRFYNSMQCNFDEIFKKLDALQATQNFHTKDIEYIKEKLKEQKEEKKENKKMIAAVIASGIALIGTVVNFFAR